MTARERTVIVLVSAALLLAACSEAAPEEQASGGGVASVESIEGSEVARVILAQEAADRLGIETGTVEAAHGGQLAIPYAAVLYDPTGRTWTYTNPEPLTYVRAEITIDAIRQDTAYATTGPPVGTTVVTVGAEELLGTEFEVAEE